MNLKEYIKITKLSQSLVKKNINRFTISNNFLIPVKEHPSYLQSYSDLNYYKSSFLLIKYFLFTFLDFIFFLMSFLKNIFNKKTVHKKKSTNQKILIISHLLNENMIFKKRDFYFGDLEKNLKKKNLTHHKIYINHLKRDSIFLNKNFNERDKITVIKNYVNFFEEIDLIYKQFKYFFKFLKLSIFEKNFKNKKFIYRAAVEFFNLSTKKNYRYSILINTFLIKYNPEKIITTFEGFPWEKIAFKTAKIYNKKIKCIGYQHAGLTKYQSIIKEKFNHGYDPDIIWVTGKNVKKILKKKKTFIIGSNKVKEYKIKKLKTKKINCLVVPEGILSECKKMFQFSIDCASSLPHINFIWRLHPTLSFEKILMQLTFKNKLPENIIISKTQNIDDDVSRSKLCLYRGSSAVYNALSHGIYSIYLNLNEKISIDTSNGLKCWKKQINNKAQFINFINNLYKMEIKKKKDKKIAIQYSKNYFEKFNINKAIDCMR